MLNTIEVVHGNSKLGLSKNMRIAKLSFQLTRMLKALGLPKIPVRFMMFAQEGINGVFSPGGLQAMMAGLPATPGIYLDARFLEEAYYPQLEAVLAHEVRHWWQWLNRKEAYVDASASLGMEIYEQVSPNKSMWWQWRECDARNWANWWMGKRLEGMAYSGVPTDTMLMERVAKNDERFVVLVQARYASVPELYVEWFGSEPVEW